jgi:lipopolysaccharide biosynthesis protein
MRIDVASPTNEGEPLVRCIAFYLPQFHPIPENDEWWGTGFTEWTNVTGAAPLFADHYQPHLPADMGFYDLRLSEIRERQAALARQYGIHGFCYYHYWFAGRRLLEHPAEAMRASGRPDYPYCFCWANENWTRRWDGADHDVLISQDPNRTDDQRFITDLCPHLRDPRYIRVNGKALLIVYRVGLLPNAKQSVEIWRETARREGVGDLYICAAKTYDTSDPSYYGVDAIVEFPPHGTRIGQVNDRYDIQHPHFTGGIYDYRQFVIDHLAQPEPGYVLHRTAMPGWDNTARRRELANFFVDATPEYYEVWLRELIARTVERRHIDERLVFINAWNEWAEGAHLEPDQRYAHQFLLATRRALFDEPIGGKPFARFSGLRE